MNHYFIIYKPYLVQSQFSPVEGKKTLAHFFDVPKDVYPVGRLDYDSEGLLILTNDKQLNHRLLHPLFQHEREYWVQVDGAITSQAVCELEKGVIISVEGKKHLTLPASVSFFTNEPLVPPRNPPIRFRKEIPATWIRMVVKEGKNRQVRKMTASVGFPTLRLIRYRIENITIDGLQPGNLVKVSRKQIYEQLFHE